MKPVAGLCAALLVTGCATGRKTDRPTAPGAIPMDLETAAAPTHLETECARAGRLSEAGEHKPAVDALDTVHRSGATCAASVLEAVEDSRRQLAAADELVRQGLDRRAAGDRTAARESFRQALAVYPRYYWAQKLERDLAEETVAETGAAREAAAEIGASGGSDGTLPAPPAEDQPSFLEEEIAQEYARLRARLSDACLDEARRAQQAGDLAAAIAWTQEALATRPDEPQSRERLVDFARWLGLTLFSAGELLQARTLWEAALSLEPANEVLRQYLEEVEARLQSLGRIQAGDVE